MRKSYLQSSFVVAVLVMMALPAVLHTYAGVSLRTIRTGSMEPVMQPGDIAIVRATNVTSLSVGDIALLFHPNDGQIEAHRVVTVAASSNGVEIVTKGDANPAVDPRILLPRTSAVERVSFVIPKAGSALATFGSPMVLGSLCALGLVVLMGFELHDRRRRASSGLSPKTVRSA